MRTFVVVMGAGALGAAARYAVDGLVSDWTGGSFPWGTLAVNISGAFLLGLIYVLLVDRMTVDPTLRIGLTVGFVGSYTTFSTLTLESVQLMQARSYLLAAANVAGSMGAGLVATVLGMVAGRAV